VKLSFRRECFQIFFLVTILTVGCGEGDRFGVEAGGVFEVFVASDVSKGAETGVNETLEAATKVWGSSGRLEYWVVGTDPQATVDLANDFCNRRVTSGDMDRKECEEDVLENKDHSFDFYRKIGARSLLSGRPSGNAGHNGGAEWGFHRMTSSLPLGFVGQLGVSGEDEQVTVLHEYWHSLQHSFIQTTSRGNSQKYVPSERTRDSLLGPVWFQEGSAVAMAEITHAQLRASGELSAWVNGEWEWQSLEKRMSQKMSEVQASRDKCPAMANIEYSSQCIQSMGYSAGAWAVIFLLSEFSQDILLTEFHPVVEEKTWEGAFIHTFGMSSSEFYEKFDDFLELSLDDQLKLLSLY
jgi:hypothetical protein